MTDNKKKNAKAISVILVLIIAVLTIGSTITFARFYGKYENKNDNVKIASAVMKTEVNHVWREREGVEDSKTFAKFDKNSGTVTLSDVEPEDTIAYYFTVTGMGENKTNEVNMKVTVSITVRLETIARDGGGNSVDYFAGWKRYGENGVDDGVKNGGYLQIFRGAKDEKPSEIHESSAGGTEVDYTGNSLLVTNDNLVTTNKTGFIMRADDAVKEYPYHIIFKLPRQNSETENYAGARVFFDVQAVAEQIQNN